jgi:TldD protein
MQRNWEYGATGGYEQVKRWNLHSKLNDEINTLGKNLRNAKRSKPKKMDVVCSPEVVGIMVHESAGHPYEADRILGREAAQAGESFISQSMLGSRIGTDDVTVVDDPRIKNSYCYFKYDNEGVKARENTLIKKGNITGFLHNRETSAAMGRSTSNGCSRASDYAKESMVRMSNTYLKKGTHTEDELIEDVKEGIFLKNYMEWNIDDRRLNQKYVGAESYYIKNGKVQHPVYNPVLEVTTPKLWSSVDGLGKKIEFHAGQCGKGEPMQGIPVSFGGPVMRLRNMRIQ